MSSFGDLVFDRSNGVEEWYVVDVVSNGAVAMVTSISTFLKHIFVACTSDCVLE